MRPQSTSAWPLALVYFVLVVYASLYPFGDWRDQGIMPWAFLTAPLPRYWTGFDVASNVLGYMPMGFLLAVSALRGSMAASGQAALAIAVLSSAALSLTMEMLQSYLPMRVPSNVDLALNIGGAVLGAIVALALDGTGVLDWWSRFRERWFVPQARGVLVLLALWPVALLFPAAVPFGLGQVLERLEAALAELLVDTPFLAWLPVRDVELQPLVPGAELLCVLLGVLTPCLLGYSIIRTAGRRIVLMLLVVAAGVAASALSAALSYGPVHAWVWFSVPVKVGVVAAMLLALLLLPLTRRGCTALALLALGVSLSVLNQAPTSAYFAQTLQTWEQGRFIRFHGIVQWIGWLWPYVALVYALALLSRRERET